MNIIGYVPILMMHLTLIPLITSKTQFIPIVYTNPTSEKEGASVKQKKKKKRKEKEKRKRKRKRKGVSLAPPQPRIDHIVLLIKTLFGQQGISVFDLRTLD